MVQATWQQTQTRCVCIARGGRRASFLIPMLLRLRITTAAVRSNS